MKYILSLLLVALLATSVFACQVTQIEKNIYDAALTYQPLDFNVVLDSTCPSQNIDIKVIDRVTNTSILDVYSGPVNSTIYSFSWVPENTGAYQIFTNISSPNVTQQRVGARTLSTAPTTTTESRTNVTVYAITTGVVLSWSSFPNWPARIEYEDFNVSMKADNKTGSTLTNLPFEIFLQNNDLNVHKLIRSAAGTTTITLTPNKKIFIDLNINQFFFYTWTTSKIKTNDTVTGTIGWPDGNFSLSTDFNSKPFVTLSVGGKNADTNTIQFLIKNYNYQDVNYCTLNIDDAPNTVKILNEVTQVDYTVQTPKLYSIDVNCITNNDHNLKDKDLSPFYRQHADLNNVPFSLEGGPISISLPFTNGDGSIDSPFEITSCNELPFINYYLNSNFVIKNDLNCSGVTFAPIGKCIDTPRGDIAYNAYRCEGSFKGTLDGNNYTILNLTSSGGLFNYISDTGIVKNINVTNANISGDEIGVISNNVLDGGLIDSVKVSNSNLSGGYSTGCLVGGLGSGHITNSRCINSTISGPQNVGGLVGLMSGGHVAGGIPSIIDSLSLDNNLVGTNSSNTWQSVGGLVGWRIRGDITNSHARTLFDANLDLIGGLIQKSSNPDYDTITNSFWDVNYSNVLVSGGGVGITSEEFNSIISNPPFN